MCDERERLIGYVYGECDAEERVRVGSHLASCEVCRAEIGGLERVREDLLAWDVPEHQPVWKAFAPPQRTAWWREVPAWAMAAAATVTFAIGAAGGMLTTAVMFAEPAQNASAASAATETVPVGYREADLTEIEQRLLQQLRAELRAERVSLPTAAPVQTMPANVVTNSELTRLETWMKQQMLTLSGRFSDDLGVANERVKVVESDISSLRGRGLGPGHN